MLDNHALLPLIKKELPGVSDQEILQGIEEFAQAHPEMSNVEALMAFNQAIQQMPNRPKGNFQDVESALEQPKEEQSNG
jgi:hypothetical protein